MSNNAQFVHIPVMVEEVLQGLLIKPEGHYVDGTFGRGGHAAALLARLNANGRMLLLDRDPEAIATARHRFADDPRVTIRHMNFSRMDQCPEATNADGILLDIGVSSPQLDDGARGFSFMHDGPLDMRMDPSTGISAATFLATADEATIVDVIWRYGEERRSRRIAAAIVDRRKHDPLTTTGELAALLVSVLGYREKHKHPATRTFQALRIHVNDEMGELEQGLSAAMHCLKPGGRLAVISFHSLEDRMVKRFIQKFSGKAPVQPRHLPPAPARPSLLRKVGKAHFAGEQELAHNPRARSAVLRIAERTGDAS